MRVRGLNVFGLVLALCLAQTGLDSARANVLVNAGFEADAVSGAGPVGGASGWSTFGNAATASSPLDPTHSGIGSLKLTGGGGFGVPGGNQTFPASEGQLWNFEGYMLTPTTLPADATFGLLKIVWSDGTNDLPPAQINVGQAGPVANPGIESLPFLNSGTAANTWIYTQAQGVAPPGTTQVSFFALFVDQSAGVAYFDDLNASMIPEPSTAALAMLSAVCIGWTRRK